MEAVPLNAAGSATIPSETKLISRKLNAKFLVYQMSPELKQVKKNMQKVESGLEKYNKNDMIDVILLPEMALTGYTFASREDIRDMCEESGKGEQFSFLQKIALKLKSYVFCGFPEIFIDQITKIEHFYNSAYLIDREGKLLTTYRKKHLYATDKTWAEEGAAFQAVQLVSRQGKTFKAGLGICMDINPYEFIDSSQFEFSDFCNSNQIDVVLFLSAWNDHEPDRIDESSIDGVLNYWLWRMRTMMNKKKELNYSKSWVFVCCDRVGTEDPVLGSKEDDGKDKGKTHYVGCSCVVKINPVQLVYCLGKKEEGIILADVALE